MVQHLFFVSCRKLHLCAEQGDFTGAEDVLAKMRAQMHAPGPKAYHALIISYVKGGNPRGALLAIRNAWTKSKLSRDFECGH